jgi:hypothetical protein
MKTQRQGFLNKKVPRGKHALEYIDPKSKTELK